MHHHPTVERQFRNGPAGRGVAEDDLADLLGLLVAGGDLELAAVLEQLGQALLEDLVGLVAELFFQFLL